MTVRPYSPRIARIEWGRVIVSGLGDYRDVKLWPGGGREWDWRETETHHVPGIQIADVEQLLDEGATVLVLSRGMDLVLQTAEETVEHLHRLGKVIHILETRKAVEKYNELVESGETVGALIHSTC